MMIALFPNESKDPSLKIAAEICQFLSSRNIEITAEDKHAKQLNVFPLSQVNVQHINFRISLGGDGTILRLIHKHPTIHAPLLGINLGSLGFLADIPLDGIFPSLEDLIKGRYRVQKRMMMEGSVLCKPSCFAVNEAVIHRAQNPCLIDLAIYVDGNYLNTFSADGMIISTPSGSTAYSLAAGGPILTPELKAFVLTPICPHTISNRPIVLMPEISIQVKYLSSYAPVEVSSDGISSFSLSTNEIFHASISSQTFDLVCLERHDYFATLREKLGWQGKLKI
ncbi:NAD(+)/NADH kinase [Candidatus Protochlamydia sp. W-9]|uniref:NAD(+)/NADH kinase n=1 Tax=Candidatus Protochlamydia sp. W-9 TaxID=1785087 RepID=UPI00096A971A|nr:NAD(+)/NADH kinase [Candidatus Protochlamydia sp. W-9]